MNPGNKYTHSEGLYDGEQLDASLQSYLIGNHERGSWMLIPLDWLHKSQEKNRTATSPYIFHARRCARLPTARFSFTVRTRDA